MKHKRYGFTIVELLIVIVIIGILAAISIATYNGMQKKVRNTARTQELVQWKKVFDVYKIQNGELPSEVNNGSYMCLGSGFPSGLGGVARCRDINSASQGYTESDNASLMSKLITVSSLPGGDRKPVGALPTVGPYVYGQVYSIMLYTAIDGSNLSDCPTPLSGVWTDGSTTVICSITIPR